MTGKGRECCELQEIVFWRVGNGTEDIQRHVGLLMLPPGLSVLGQGERSGPI